MFIPVSYQSPSSRSLANCQTGTLQDRKIQIPLANHRPRNEQAKSPKKLRQGSRQAAQLDSDQRSHWQCEKQGSRLNEWINLVSTRRRVETGLFEPTIAPHIARETLENACVRNADKGGNRLRAPLKINLGVSDTCACKSSALFLSTTYRRELTLSSLRKDIARHTGTTPNRFESLQCVDQDI